MIFSIVVCYILFAISATSQFIVPPLNENITSINQPLGDDWKIAFLFMTAGHMPLEDIWHEFFKWRCNSSHYSIYVHPKQNFIFPPGSIFHGKEIHNSLDVKWGGMTQVLGIRLLVEAALQDPLNHWFTLMSESCIPIVPFSTWRNSFQNFDKSIINACPYSQEDMETESRWRASLEQVGLKKEHWRKSATWFALKRKHAEIFSTYRYLEASWEGVPCCDEHYLPTLFAFHGLDNETTCSDGFVHVVWPNNWAAHPKTYSGDDISTQLFASLHRAVGTKPGFNMLCSGVPNVCHFTARKFAPNTRFPLLENIDLILSDDEHPYGGNPWDHHEDKIRHNKNFSEFYLIENNVLRLIPDNSTAYFMHIDLANSKELSAYDLEDYPMGRPVVSRKDGVIMKSAKQRIIYFMKDGHRRGIPSLTTFYNMGLKLEDTLVVPETDLDQIPLGDLLPEIPDPNPVNG